MSASFVFFAIFSLILIENGLLLELGIISYYTALSKQVRGSIVEATRFILVTVCKFHFFHCNYRRRPMGFVDRS